MKKKFVTSLALAVMGSAMMAGSAMATPTLMLDDGLGNIVTITDQLVGGGDVNAIAGAVTYVGAVGANWWINVTTGLTMPAVGTAAIPYMDVSSVNTSLGAGNLSVWFSEVGFAQLAPGLNGFVLNLGGTTSGTVNAAAYYDDATNTLFGQATEIATLGPYGPGSFSGTASYAGIPGNPYSLTLLTQITHNNAGVTSYDLELKPVPEPATMLLFGTGLVGLAGAARRRLSKKV